MARRAGRPVEDFSLLAKEILQEDQVEGGRGGGGQKEGRGGGEPGALIHDR